MAQLPLPAKGADLAAPIAKMAARGELLHESNLRGGVHGLQGTLDCNPFWARWNSLLPVSN
eukprot:3776746-Pyramimonas_sp.AAC.1